MANDQEHDTSVSSAQTTMVVTGALRSPIQRHTPQPLQAVAVCCVVESLRVCSHVNVKDACNSRSKHRSDVSLPAAVSRSLRRQGGVQRTALRIGRNTSALRGDHSFAYF